MKSHGQKWARLWGLAVGKVDAEVREFSPMLEIAVSGDGEGLEDSKGGGGGWRELQVDSPSDTNSDSERMVGVGGRELPVDSPSDTNSDSEGMVGVGGREFEVDSPSDSDSNSEGMVGVGEREFEVDSPSDNDSDSDSGGGEGGGDNLGGWPSFALHTMPVIRPAWCVKERKANHPPALKATAEGRKSEKEQWKLHVSSYSRFDGHDKWDCG